MDKELNSLAAETNEKTEVNLDKITSYLGMFKNFDSKKDMNEMKDDFRDELGKMSEGEKAALLNDILDKASQGVLLDNADLLQGIMGSEELAYFLKSADETATYHETLKLFDSGIIKNGAMTNELIENLDFNSKDGLSYSILTAVFGSIDKFPGIDQERLFEYALDKEGELRDEYGMALAETRDKFPNIDDDRFYHSLQRNDLQVAINMHDKFPNISVEDMLIDIADNDMHKASSIFSENKKYLYDMIDDNKLDFLVAFVKEYGKYLDNNKEGHKTERANFMNTISYLLDDINQNAKEGVDDLKNSYDKEKVLSITRLNWNFKDNEDLSKFDDLTKDFTGKDREKIKDLILKINFLGEVNEYIR